MTEEKFRVFLNYVAAVILSFCVFGMIVWAWESFNTVPPQTHKIILTVSPDSIYESKKFSYYTDSLIQVIGKHEQVIADKYESVLDEKADSQKYWSIAGVLVSVILGIAGFFGFKTFKDIESGCRKTAEDVANEKAKEESTKTSKSETKEYLEGHLAAEIRNASNVYLGNQESHIKEMVKNAVVNTLADVSDKIDELSDKLEELDSRLTMLERSGNTSGEQQTEPISSEATNPPTDNSSGISGNSGKTIAIGEVNLFE